MVPPLGQYPIPVKPDMRGPASILVFEPGTDKRREAIFDVFRGLTPSLVTTTTSTVVPSAGELVATTTTAATTTTSTPAPAC
jgi:hypothetical protein